MQVAKEGRDPEITFLVVLSEQGTKWKMLTLESSFMSCYQAVEEVTQEGRLKVRNAALCQPVGPEPHGVELWEACRESIHHKPLPSSLFSIPSRRKPKTRWARNLKTMLKPM